MGKICNVPLSERLAAEIDSRRGLVKRATYVRAVLLAAWEANLPIEGVSE